MPPPTTSSQLDAPLLSCEPALEDEVYFHNEVVLGGWALSAAGIAELLVELDGTPVDVVTGRDTPAVAAAHPEIDAAHEAGFEARVDCRAWGRGEHALAVTAIDRDGRRTGHETTVRVDPYEPPPGSLEEIKATVTAGGTVMWCDEPTLDGTATARRTLAVRGWAHGRDGLEGALVTIDGRHRYKAILGHKRPDLAWKLGVPELASAGFEVNVDVREQTSGEHHVSVVVVGGDGRLVGVEGTVLFETGVAPGGEAPRPAEVGGGGPVRPSPERLVPEAAAGRLVVAEHQARYRWAAQTARGRDVLDAGCGVGYGALILAEAGAQSVTGVDRSSEAIFNARERAGAVAEFTVADLQDIPLDDGSFDLITCFEAIEHIVHPERALDELRRVLRPDGVLLISSPHRGVYTPGNPHHVHEYTPSELRDALSARFNNVALYRQHAHLASLLCDEDGFRSTDGGQILDADLRKVAAAEGGELYTVAAAGDDELPALRGVAVAADVFDYKEMVELAWALEERAIVAEADAAISHEQARASAAAHERAEELVRSGEHARLQAERGLAAQEASISWRVTAPLRWAKARARARAGR